MRRRAKRKLCLCKGGGKPRIAAESPTPRRGARPKTNRKLLFDGGLTKAALRRILNSLRGWVKFPAGGESPRVRNGQIRCNSVTDGNSPDVRSEQENPDGFFFF